MSSDRYIRIFDTTLRDGEQAPGATLNKAEKLEVAHQLARLKVDIIEAGFPIASPDDFEAVQAIATDVKGPRIAGLARAIEEDIRVCWDAVKVAAVPRIHTFISTSAVHMRYQIKKTPAEVLADTRAMVTLAAELVRQHPEADLEFSAMDASRSDPAFLAEVLSVAVECGATTINVPDTVGYALPLEFGEFILDLHERCPSLHDVAVSVHCHNDLGLATANSLAAVRAGATQVECAVNGIGERAGNASLEEVVMAIRTRGDSFDCTTGVETTEIARTSRLVSSLTGYTIQRNKAIVGRNAFAHESGIHQAGVLSEASTFEIMTPADVGLTDNDIVLGKHSGRHALRAKLAELGYTLSDAELGEAFKRFKDVADKKKRVTVLDLEALVERGDPRARGPLHAQELRQPVGLVDHPDEPGRGAGARRGQEGPQLQQRLRRERVRRHRRRRGHQRQPGRLPGARHLVRQGFARGSARGSRGRRPLVQRAGRQFRRHGSLGEGLCEGRQQRRGRRGGLMGSTITEKILARAAGRDEVHAGDIIEAKIDLALANDITAPLAIAEFEKAGFTKVWDPARIALVPDHFAPNKDIKAAGQAVKMREFARKHEIVNYFEVGRMGIEHVLLPDTGMVAPGDVVIGADSHTCTYGAVAAFSSGVGSTDFAAAMAWGHVWLRVPETFKFVYTGTPCPWVTGKDLMLHTIGLIGVDGALYQAMEFTGEAIETLSMDERFTMCNMAIEAGGKSGIVGFDEKTTQYLQSRPDGSRARTVGKVFASDRDAEYAEVLEIDASAVQPTVSKPHLPSNTAAAADCGDITIDQVVIGSCTNGRLARPAPGGRHPQAARRSTRTCAASSCRAPRTSASRPSPTAPCRRSSRPAAPSARPPAAPASAATWASSPRASAPWPPPTATSSAAWVTPAPRSTWPAPTWPPPPRWPATSPRPKKSAP